MLDNNIVTILIWMFDTIKQFDNTFFSNGNLFDHTFERLLSCWILDAELFTQIRKVNSRNTTTLGINEFNTCFSAFFRKRQSFIECVSGNH